MDTKMGPSYANLFVGFIEHQFLSQYHGPKPELYGRYRLTTASALPPLPTNVIYMSCITCTYCKKLYISETIRRLYTLIFLIILNSICQFAAFPYILAV